MTNSDIQQSEQQYQKEAQAGWEAICEELGRNPQLYFEDLDELFHEGEPELEDIN